MLQTRMASEAPATSIAPLQQQVTGPAPSAKAPKGPTDALRAPASSRIDDPEFEQAILELADREGWWHEDPDAIVAQFDMILTGISDRSSYSWFAISLRNGHEKEARPDEKRTGSRRSAFPPRRNPSC
jgi:hypothetical protein